MAASLDSTTVSKTYVDDIIRNMKDTLIVVDRSEKIRTVNRALLRLLGYAEAELVDQPFSIISGSVPDDALRTQSAQATFDQTLTSGSLKSPYWIGSILMPSAEAVARIFSIAT